MSRVVESRREVNHGSITRSCKVAGQAITQDKPDRAITNQSRAITRSTFPQVKQSRPQSRQSRGTNHGSLLPFREGEPVGFGSNFNDRSRWALTVNAAATNYKRKIDMTSPDLFQAFADGALPLPARLDAARQILSTLDKAMASIKQSVADTIKASDVHNNDDLLATLYWGYEDMVPTSLLGNFHQLRPVLESRCPWTYPCPSCSKDQPVTSRLALQQLRKIANGRAKPWESSRFECADCRNAQNSARNAGHQEAMEAQRRRVRELRTMPYRDYLQSVEWQERRKVRLRAARYRCQVCNTNGQRLNVHHRTYERRGEELAADLIVLCEPCHHLFHRNGSLAPHDADH